MKKTILATAIAITLSSTPLQAQSEPEYETWLGGFASYYEADQDKPDPLAYLDDGHGIGLEAGFRFDPRWAVRFELSRLLLSTQEGEDIGYADDGSMFGADLVYFLNDDLAYLFGGGRAQTIDDTYRMAAFGIGKHWEIDTNLRLITELTKYYDFGQSYNELSAKVGIAYAFGTVPLPIERPDTDGDGVYDAVDRCPNTPVGTEVDATGCNIDMDGDGVLNVNDECPRTPAGVKVKANGCAIGLDSDNDGVPDSQDKCPDTPVNDKVDSVGCSIFVDKDVSVELKVLFANDSSAVENPDAPRIVEFADFMKRFPDTKAVIEGHTSSVGSDSYNQRLSEKRANSVRTMLIGLYGIEAERLQAVGYGESRLIDLADTEEAHAMNRRIEVKISTSVQEKAVR